MRQRTPVVYHGTPLTPRAALEAMAGRSFCISFFRPDDVVTCERIADEIMYDNGAFSFWMAARKAGNQACEAQRDWSPYYDWVDARLQSGRWAVVPDAIAMPSQLNDALLNEWPHGKAHAAPVYHMDEPISRLARLCEQGWERVCLGWVGETQAENQVGSDTFLRRLDEIDRELPGFAWAETHMMRGVAVAGVRPFPQCRQHQPRAKWLAVRQPDRRLARRSVAGPQSLRRQVGGQAR